MARIHKQVVLTQVEAAAQKIDISMVQDFSIQIQYAGSGTVELQVSNQADPLVSDATAWSVITDSSEVLADVVPPFTYNVTDQQALWLRVVLASVTAGIVTVTLKLRN